MKVNRSLVYTSMFFRLIRYQKIREKTYHFLINTVSLVQENLAMAGSSINQTTLTMEARQIKDVVNKLNGFKLDHTEYTCLKALALFKPGIFIFGSDFYFYIVLCLASFKMILQHQFLFCFRSLNSSTCSSN